MVDNLNMETIAIVDTETRDDNEVENSPDYFRVPTILRHILQQFSTTELVTLSLVNKLWNFEARSVMKERGNLLANTSSDQQDDNDVCHKLIDFASDLENMRVVPFCGLYVDMFHRDTCQWISNGSEDRAYKSILNRLPWKRFLVNFMMKDDLENIKNCPGLMLVKQILGSFCGVLEDLHLSYGREEFYENAFQDQRFLCLKSLAVEPGYFDEEPLTSAFIKALVSRAPNLEKLCIHGELNFQENVLQGSSAVLVPGQPFRPLFEQVCEALISSVRASEMAIHVLNLENERELLRRFVPMVLAASRTSLETLYINVHFVEHLSRYGICFPNVTILLIFVNCHRHNNFEPTSLKLPKHVDLTRVFPKLNQAEISHDIIQGRRYILLRQTRANTSNLKFYLNIKSMVVH